MADLTLKAPFTTAADDIHKYFFIAFQRKKDVGPVVQSIVSLTSSLRGQLVKCFTTL